MRSLVLLAACGAAATPPPPPISAPPPPPPVAAKWVGEAELVVAGLTSTPTSNGTLVCRGNNCWCFRVLDCDPCSTVEADIDLMHQISRGFCMMEVGKQCGVTYFNAANGIEAATSYYVDDHLVGEVVTTDSDAYCDHRTRYAVRGRILDCDEPAREARTLCPPEGPVLGNTENPKNRFLR